MTLNEELLKAATEHSARVKQIESKYAVLNTGLSDLLEGYEQPHIHHYKLYGSVGSIDVKGCDYESIRKGKAPDASLLHALLEAYPPIPLVMVKDGCKSFRPARTLEPKEGMDITPMFPVTVRIETYTRQAASFEWYAELNGQLWQFRVSFLMYRVGELGSLAMRARYYGNGDKVASWDVCEFTPKHKAQRIRWASGGPEYPNSFTVYWTDGTFEVSKLAGLVKE